MLEDALNEAIAGACKSAVDKTKERINVTAALVFARLENEYLDKQAVDIAKKMMLARYPDWKDSV